MVPRFIAPTSPRLRRRYSASALGKWLAEPTLTSKGVVPAGKLCVSVITGACFWYETESDREALVGTPPLCFVEDRPLAICALGSGSQYAMPNTRMGHGRCAHVPRA